MGYHEENEINKLHCSIVTSHQKLYYRENEVSSLLAAYTDVVVHCQSRLVLILGESGTGKTTIVNYVRQMKDDLGNDKVYGYWITGRFFHSQRMSSYFCPFLAALNTFLRELQQDDRMLLKQKMENLVANKSDILLILEQIPEMKKILNLPLTNDTSIKTATSCMNCTGEINASKERWDNALGYRNRFKSQFISLLQSISKALPTKPLILFMDDIQWAIETELEFMFELATDLFKANVQAMLILTCDDSGRLINDISPDHLSKITIPLINKYKNSMVTIKLENMNVNELHKFVNDRVQGRHGQSQTLSDQIWSRTKGNYFLSLAYMNYYLTGIKRQKEFNSGMIENTMFKFQKLGVETDYAKVDFVENLELFKFTELSEQTQEDLKLLSCLGSSFNVQLIHYLISHSLDEATQKGFLTMDPFGKSNSFSHSKVQEIIYDSISVDDRKKYHYNIGRTLWKNIELENLEKYILVVVRQILLGREFLHGQRESTAVAKLYLAAGEKVARLSAFQLALTLFTDGISLLDSRSWRDEYELCQNLYSAAAECSYSCGYSESVPVYADPVIRNSRCLVDSVRARLMIITALGSQGKKHEATDKSLELLNYLGEHFPSKPSLTRVVYAMKKLERRLLPISTEAILNYRVMEDPNKLAAMQTLNLAFTYAFSKSQLLVALLGFRMMKLTLDYGVSGLSCMGFAAMGNALCVSGSVDEGYRIGQMGVKLNERFNNRSFLARFNVVYYKGVHCWKRPIRECIDPLFDAHKVGLETGDIEFATLSAGISFLFRMEFAPLSEIHNGLQDLYNRTKTVKQDIEGFVFNPYWECVKHLLGFADRNPLSLSGELACQKTLQTTSSSLYIMSLYPRLFLCFLFGDFSDEALQMADALKSFGSTTRNAFFTPAMVSKFMILEGLFRIDNCRQSNKRFPRRAMSCLRVLRKLASNGPYSYLWQSMTLEAELSSRLGVNHFVPKYVAAIAMCQQSGSIYGVALANELLAKRLIEHGLVSEAEPYARKAILTYAQWGAISKVQHLHEAMIQCGCSNLL